VAVNNKNIKCRVENVALAIRGMLGLLSRKPERHAMNKDYELNRERALIPIMETLSDVPLIARASYDAGFAANARARPITREDREVNLQRIEAALLADQAQGVERSDRTIAAELGTTHPTGDSNTHRDGCSNGKRNSASTGNHLIISPSGYSN
jgi:hypothetical protein